MRCMHLGRRGEQCPEQAMLGSNFCASHSPLLDAEVREDRKRFPFVYRLAAFVLLLIFVLQGYQTLRAWLGL